MDKYFTFAEPRFFSFEEMTRTDTGLDNRPSTWEQIENLMVTANRLDTIRKKFGKAVRVNCAFRSDAVNERVGGVSNSAHTKGLAADICAYDGTETGNRRIFAICQNSLLSLNIDQLILYTEKPGVESSRIRFMHVGFRASVEKPRGQASFAHLCVSFGAKSHYGKEHDRFGIRFYCSMDEIE